MDTAPIIFPISDNLRALIRKADDNPRAVIIHLQAKNLEEPASFQVTTAAAISSNFWELPQLEGGNWLMLTEEILPGRYRIRIDRSFLDHSFIIGLEFDAPDDPISSVLKIEPWDGTGGNPVLTYIEPPDV